MRSEKSINCFINFFNLQFLIKNIGEKITHMHMAACQAFWEPHVMDNKCCIPNIFRQKLTLYYPGHTCKTNPSQHLKNNCSNSGAPSRRSLHQGHTLYPHSGASLQIFHSIQHTELSIPLCPPYRRTQYGDRKLITWLCSLRSFWHCSIHTMHTTQCFYNKTLLFPLLS